MVRCQEISHNRPMITLVEASVTAIRYQGTVPERAVAVPVGRASERATVILIVGTSPRPKPPERAHSQQNSTMPQDAEPKLDGHRSYWRTPRSRMTRTLEQI